MANTCYRFNVECTNSEEFCIECCRQKMLDHRINLIQKKLDTFKNKSPQILESIIFSKKNSDIEMHFTVKTFKF